MGNTLWSTDTDPEGALTPSGLTVDDEEKLKEKFGHCTLEEFIEVWNKTGAPKWWGVAMYQALMTLGSTGRNGKANKEQAAFFAGVRRAVGHCGCSVLLVETMFPEDLTQEEDKVHSRLAFSYWVTCGDGHFPRNVTFDKVRDVLSIRLRAGVRNILFDEPCTKYLQCENSVLKKSWALGLQFDSTDWDQLYCSKRHGRSFARLIANIQMYEAPSVLVLRTDKGAVLGAVNFENWDDMGGQYSSAAAFLFIDQPAFSVLAATGKSTNMVYVNQRNKYAPIGIGFGGQSSCPRLWIDANFDGHFLQSDAAYEKGTINEGDEYQVSFSVHGLEVWGLGGIEALEKQQDQQGFRNDLKMQRRKVDRARMAEGGMGEILFEKTFAMADEARAEVEAHRREVAEVE